MLRAFRFLFAAMVSITSPTFAQDQAQGSQGFLIFSGAYSEQYKETLGVEFVARNLFSKGIDVNLAAQRNSLGHQWNIDVRRNRDLTTQSFGAPSLVFMGLRGSEYAWDDALYQTSKYGAYFGIGLETGQNSSLRATWDLYEFELSNVSASASPIIAAEAGRQFASGLTFQYNFDTRNRRSEPTSGSFAFLRAELYGLGGDADWVGISAGVDHHRSLGPQTVLSFSISGGVAQGRSGYTLNVGERAFLGNPGLRGFEFGGIGPIDSNGTTSTSLGGNKYVLGSIELEHKMVDLRRSSLSAFGFVDAGSVWDLDVTTGGFIDPIDDSFFLNQAAGLGVKWNTQQGSFSIYYAKAMRARATDVTKEIGFSFHVGF